MALLKTTSDGYLDPRAGVLFGQGNKSITNDQISGFVNQNKSNPQAILSSALANNVSVDQIANAMSGTPGFDKASINKYIAEQGISNTNVGGAGTPGTQATPNYLDPRASIVYGRGNQGINNDQISSFVNQNASDPQAILNAALRHNVSADQVAEAMRGTPGFDSTNIQKYLNEQGINRTIKPDNVSLNAALSGNAPNVNYQNVAPSTARLSQAYFDEDRDTVQGRLAQVLNPNSQLMQRAQFFANQQANARGLLNSSLATSAAQAAMTDAGLQIATPDAAAFNQFGLQNTEAANRQAQFNADQLNRVNTANASQQMEAGKINADNFIRTQQFNAGQQNDLTKLEASINSRFTEQGFQYDLDAAKTDLENRNKGALAALQSNLDRAAAGDKLSMDASLNFMKMFNDIQLGSGTEAEKSEKIAGLVEVFNKIPKFSRAADASGATDNLDFSGGSGATSGAGSGLSLSTAVKPQDKVGIDGNVVGKVGSGDNVRTLSGQVLDAPTVSAVKQVLGPSADPSAVISLGWRDNAASVANKTSSGNGLYSLALRNVGPQGDVNAEQNRLIGVLNSGIESGDIIKIPVPKGAPKGYPATPEDQAKQKIINAVGAGGGGIYSSAYYDPKNLLGFAR